MMSGSSNRKFVSAFALGAVTALAGVALWTGLAAPRHAFAQIPDAGAQRAAMVSELRAANQKLAQIVKLLGEQRELSKTGGGAPKRTKP